MPTTGMVLCQNIQNGATAKASVVQVGAAGSKGGAGRDEFRSDHFARCQQRNARRICPDILRRGAANGMLQCQRGVRGQKCLCDGTGGWAGVGSTCAEAGRGAFCAAAASITNRAAAKRSRAVSSSQGRSWPARWHHRTSRFQTASPGAAVPPGRGRSARQQHR